MSNNHSLGQKTEFTEHRLTSGSRKNVYNILKFHGSKPVKLKEFSQPVKLHRKQIQPEIQTLTMDDGTGEGSSGPNGSANTAPGTPGVATADPTIIAPYGNASRNKQMLFKKRTKQVFPTDEESRKIREQEAKPWVIEDTDNTNYWSGVLEGGQQSNYYLFICTDEGFQVVPAHKWYKFNQKLTYATLTIEEAEEQLIKAQKKDSDRWMMRKRLLSKLDSEGAGEEEEPKGGKKLKLVDHEDQISFFEDDDDDGNPKKKRGAGGSKHGDIDEVDFDEEFQDDEEAPPELDGDQEETKENEARQKAKPVIASEDEEEEDEEKEELTAAGKDLKKALRTLEKNAAYDSDDNENPYLSKAPENPSASTQQIKKPVPVNTNKKIPPPSKPTKSSGIFTPKNGAASKPVRPPVNKPNAAARLAEAKKRKDESDENDKNLSTVSSSNASDSNLITEAEITELIRHHRLTTKDLIVKVKKKLKADPRNKQLISTIVKKVATTKDGYLELK
ncbi:Rap30/74 interaction domain-containing protein [Basidiobolus meristosporus CBS 931.73]|uniref:Transcription initiation factor IIF subunit alpha n=1 Tax=Basidiobolus meristosporus CBS 931.73 TaxID=1314790 RepID=A0A1Y1Z338_9FUNG|nr:Rap30/74 interaction domain-containing protein [Basidiobolus meristosporus CBS 931.73]|eukprot:ORY04619.1 Rap30/74 interaction domain-containing protein [Basidiobolus meristosporus CBS 931.73]